MLVAIEQSQFVGWFLASIWGFPTFIALHSVGMAFVVGISLVISLRQFGLGRDITYSTFVKLFKAAWLGFLINLVTGLGLLASRITEYLVDPTFLVKMLAVFAGVVGLGLLQRHFRKDFIEAEPASIQRAKKGQILGSATIFAWLLGITAGRWIAYLSGLYG